MKHLQLGRRDFLKGVCAGALAAAVPSRGQAAQKKDIPNIVVILSDDQGWGDLSIHGNVNLETPNIDSLARDGALFERFYVCPVCAPTRAEFLTGRYHPRGGVHGVTTGAERLNIDEKTIGDAFKAAGYATAAYGKWHNGTQYPYHPNARGFDEFYGFCSGHWGQYFDPILEHNGQIVRGKGFIIDDLTDHALTFIERNKDRPFFLYLAHNAPHVPLFVSDKFKGKSQRGLYGDACMEIDWSVGEVLGTIKRLGLDEHTLVIFTSDNGPWLTYGNHAGSAKPLRDGKTTTFDGGQRTPGIMRWPGKIPAGRVCREIITAMDILPTLAMLADARLPAKPIDGKNIWPLMTGQLGAKSPHEAVFYYNAWQLEAVRSGTWKLVLPHQYYAVAEPGKDGMPGRQVWASTTMALYDLLNDIGEETDVSAEHTDIVARLLSLVAKAREDLGDGVMQVNPEKKDFFQSRKLYRIPGKNCRPPGRA